MPPSTVSSSEHRPRFPGLRAVLTALVGAAVAFSPAASAQQHGKNGQQLKTTSHKVRHENGRWTVTPEFPVLVPGDVVTITVPDAPQAHPYRETHYKWKWETSKKDRGWWGTGLWAKTIITPHTHDLDLASQGTLGREIVFVLQIGDQTIRPTAADPGKTFRATSGGSLKLLKATVDPKIPSDPRPEGVPDYAHLLPEPKSQMVAFEYTVEVAIMRRGG